MSWLPDPELVERARCAGRLVTPAKALTWFNLESARGRWLAEAEGIDAARAAAVQMIEDGETQVLLFPADARFALERCYLSGGIAGGGRTSTAVAWETGTNASVYELECA